jgi:hypothetical protein
MGIDKPDVRFVLHWSLPKAMEGLYQEAGRAGRDGLPSAHTLFFSPADHTRVVRLIKRGRKQAGGRGGTAAAVALADAVRDYCTERQQCRRVQLLAYLGEPFAAARCAGTCDNCQRAAGTLPPGHDEPLPGALDGAKGGGKPAKPRARKKGAKRAKGPKAPRRAAAKPPAAPRASGGSGGGGAAARAASAGSKQAAAAARYALD